MTLAEIEKLTSETLNPDTLYALKAGEFSEVKDDD